MNKFNFNKIKRYIFIFLTATIFLSNLISKSLADEDIFVVENIKIEGIFDVNFSRDKFIDKGINRSFTNLMSKILLSKDIDKVDNLNLKSIKNFIDSFQILEEQYIENKYIVNFTVRFNRDKVKKFLRKKNISFSEPKNATVVFFPVLIIDDEIKIYNENYFYKNWINKNKNKSLINFILPLEELDDFLSINNIKEQIENLNVDEITKKYNTDDYVIVLMQYNNEKLNTYLKIGLNSNKYTESFFYNLKNWEDLSQLNFIMDDLKLKIVDVWKHANLINLGLPLSIYVQFHYKNPQDLYSLEKILKQINIINSYQLEEFTADNSFFKINYYGDPKKLSDEFSDFDYKLINVEGYWEIRTNG